MKFKSQDKQNQLIEKITPVHLVVGIDIAQQIHVARAVNFRGIVLGNPYPFPMTRMVLTLSINGSGVYKPLIIYPQPSLAWNRPDITGLT